MLPELREQDFSERVGDLGNVRRTLGRFLSKNSTTTKVSFFNKMLFGREDIVTRWAEVKIGRGRYSLKVETSLGLGQEDWDSSPIRLSLHPLRHRGIVIGSTTVPSLTKYFLMDLDDRKEINRKLDLIQKDIVPALVEHIKKDLPSVMTSG